MLTDGGILKQYQRDYLNDTSRFKAAMFARQTGKTFTGTLEPVDHCMLAEAMGKRSKWTILSASKAQAKEALDEGVKLHLAAYKMAFEELEYPFSDEVDELTYEVRFPGGSRIRAVAANPQTARGKSDNLILDEFGIHKNSHEIWRAVFPIVSRRDLLLRVLSTANGMGNKFHEVMTSEKMGRIFSRHIVDIYKAVAHGLDRDIDELRDGLNDPDGWAQEFECLFIDAASSWLTFDLIDACEDELAGIPELYQGGLCFLGMDFGRRRDLTSIYVFEDVDGVLWLREWVEMEQRPFYEQMAELKRLFDTYRIVRGGLDQTGMGEKPVEDAKLEHGDARIQGVLFTGPAKLNMAISLKQRMEDRRIKLPHRTALRDDLHSVTKRVGPTGIPIISAPRLNGSHADRFWACALACSVADSEAPPDLSLMQSTGSLSELWLPNSKASKSLLLPDGQGGWSTGRRHNFGGY